MNSSNNYTTLIIIKLFSMCPTITVEVPPAVHVPLVGIQCISPSNIFQRLGYSPNVRERRVLMLLCHDSEVFPSILILIPPTIHCERLKNKPIFSLNETSGLYILTFYFLVSDLNKNSSRTQTEYFLREKTKMHVFSCLWAACQFTVSLFRLSSS